MPKKKNYHLLARNRTPQLKQVAVEQLLLDFENPRLASLAKTGDQDELLKVLWEEMAVDEVALSIATNGFFQEEQLFVIPKLPRERDEERQKYTVVEGNRRLAAVRILRDDSLRRKLRATDLPAIDAVAKSKLDKLPVSVYDNREELWDFFGFRHINGPKPWDAFSKAKYVADVRDKYDVPLDEIAKSIGDRHSTVRRLYRGYHLLLQAESMAGFDREDRIRNRFYFSHLYTAADQPEFQKFLGIDAEKSLKPNPVPRVRFNALKDLMVWLYGSKSAGREPVVHSQNPDLNILREVLAQPNALSALRSGFSLQRSHEIGIGDKRRFRDALTKAKEDLQQGKATVTTGYTGEEDLYTTISDIQLYVETIRDEMEAKRKKSSGKRRGR